MAEPPEDARPSTALLLAAVCENADAIRSRLSRRPDGPALLEGVLDRAVEGEDPRAALDVLHQALRALGATRGLHGYTRTRGPGEGGGVGVPGLGPARPAPGTLGCPRGRCARAWRPTPAEDVPTCRIHGEPLAPASGG
ncbi:hypothetical protein PWG71_05765 [Nocardiopsis sp. N85]|uniref:hypothetical protein n=1 Tax=Nocardiopsis sp. N85 TaxID=3029400 RepID=UPI00237F83BD|nr:hypothetical protein [Nocardiopsis sp. N85]MDE3720887.1 hypothetical protein [Nocardiopsis sp. N85]